MKNDRINLAEIVGKLNEKGIAVLCCAARILAKNKKYLKKQNFLKIPIYKQKFAWYNLTAKMKKGNE